MAERITRRMLRDVFGYAASAVSVESAGTSAISGDQIHAYSGQILNEWGINCEDFRSRALTTVLLDSADLILAAERTQRAACASLRPAVVRRTFTLHQFARLAAHAAVHSSKVSSSVPESFHALLRLVDRTRHLAPPTQSRVDDLADPVQRPITEFRTCAVEIHSSMAAILRAVDQS